ncbi:MAG: hypothetical protein ABSA57_09705 [Candidatus Acidiferrales bacterium]
MGEALQPPEVWSAHQREFYSNTVGVHRPSDQPAAVYADPNLKTELDFASNQRGVWHPDETPVQADVTYQTGPAGPRSNRDGRRPRVTLATEMSSFRLAHRFR